MFRLTKRRDPDPEPTRFAGGLWRIWDDDVVVGWVSTDDFGLGWVEVAVTFPDHDPSKAEWEQPWSLDVVPADGDVLADLLDGHVQSDLRGSDREYTVTWVEDDEFERLAPERYDFY